MIRRSLAGAIAAQIWLFSGALSAAMTEIAPGANLQAEIDKLGPGDELVLQGGTYTLGAKLVIGVSGTAAAPIVIRAKDGETPVITRDESQNVINVENAQYVSLIGLEITGGSHGIRLLSSSFIAIERCHIHDTGDVALSANIPGSQYQGLRIVRNHIHHTNGTGEGMYLGCNQNACQMFDSLIEGNYIHHTNQAGVIQGDGIEIKQGSYGNIVRDNVIHDTNYPCLLLYGTAGKAQNLVERNAMWRCGDHGIQVEADAIVRNNLILSAAVDGIRNQNHQQMNVKDLEIVHNTIVNVGNAIRSDHIAGSVLIANNALYSQTGSALRVAGTLTGLVVSGNVGAGSLQGVSSGVDTSGSLALDFVDAAFDTSKLDVFPKPGSKLIAAGDAQHVVVDDFNGTLRAGVADVGAYKFTESGNPGWPVGEGPKPEGGAGGAGGSSGAGGGSAGGGGASGSGAAGGASGSAGTGGGGTAGSAAAAGASPADGSGDDAGCGCRIGKDRTPAPLPLALAGLALALLSRRARR
jgi:MYXO-CTERM domain-containing protein